jgi:hypothetical protein
MRLNIPKLSARQIPLILVVVLLIFVFVRPGKIHAQRNTGQAVAQVGLGSPLPVFVVNDPPSSLPEGFAPGTQWKFTTWTVPSALISTVTIQKTEGGWALLTTPDAPTVPKWYYVPQMPGAWEPLAAPQ